VSDQGRLSGWRLNVLRVLALAAVIAITAYIYACRSQLEHLEVYGYPGIFLLSILANATVILPAPGIAITFALGAVFNPIGVALAAGAGATLGELTGYVVGLSGQGFAERTDLYDRLERWTERYGGLFIFVLSLVPNPFFDLAGAAAGALSMPVHKFLLWTLIGKTLKMLGIAYAGGVSADWLLRVLGTSP
jgi:uncharacterized membrane protein YdjX (TVP38/TMEM64 family)